MELGTRRRGGWAVARVALAAAVLVGCTRTTAVEIHASAPPPPAPPTTTVPTEKFQGSVAAVDLAAEELVVDVQIVWAPVIKAERQERRVAVDAQTRWEPPGTGLAGLRQGDEVQVEASSGPDGIWDALHVQLFDIE